MNATTCAICLQPMTAWTANVTASERTGGQRAEHHHHSYGNHGQHNGGPCVCPTTEGN